MELRHLNFVGAKSSSCHHSTMHGGEMHAARWNVVRKAWKQKYLELLSRASVHEKNSRSFNSCHAFSMLHLANDDKTACFNQPKDKAYPTMLSICGRVYHTMLDTAAEDLDLNNILNWYVRDPVAMHNANNPVKTHPMHFDKSLKHSELDEMNALITQLNPIARNLRSMGSLAADCVGAHVSLKWDTYFFSTDATGT